MVVLRCIGWGWGWGGGDSPEDHPGGTGIPIYIRAPYLKDIHGTLSNLRPHREPPLEHIRFKICMGWLTFQPLGDWILE